MDLRTTGFVRMTGLLCNKLVPRLDLFCWRDIPKAQSPLPTAACWLTIIMKVEVKAPKI